jgi:hypothetical protein
MQFVTTGLPGHSTLMSKKGIILSKYGEKKIIIVEKN